MRRWLSIIIVLGTVIIGFLALYLRTSEDVPFVPEAPPPATIESVSFTSSYEDGVHTITGEATVGTRCTPLTSRATLTEGVPPVISVDLTAPVDESVCLRLKTVKEFEVTIEAPEDAPIELYANTVPVTPVEPS